MGGKKKKKIAKKKSRALASILSTRKWRIASRNGWDSNIANSTADFYQGHVGLRTLMMRLLIVVGKLCGMT